MTDRFALWVKGLKPETGKVYGRLVQRTCNIIHLTPNEAFEKVKQESLRNQRDTYRSLIDATADFTERLRYNATYAIRSFLLTNTDIILPPAKLQTPELVKEPTRISWEQALEICAAASKPYNLVLKLMLFSGWGIGEFLRFNTAENWEHIRTKLTDGNRDDYVRVEMPKGRKRNRSPFYTLIPRLLLQQVIDSKIPLPISTSHSYSIENGKRKHNNIKGIPLDTAHHASSRLYIDRVFTTALKQAPIKLKGKPSPHELRDTFRTQAGFVKCDPDVAEFAMGHEIDPYGYKKIFYDEKYMWEELKKIYGPTPALFGEVAGETKQLREQVNELQSQVTLLLERDREMQFRLEHEGLSPNGQEAEDRVHQLLATGGPDDKEYLRLKQDLLEYHARNPEEQENFRQAFRDEALHVRPKSEQELLDKELEKGPVEIKKTKVHAYIRPKRKKRR